MILSPNACHKIPHTMTQQLQHDDDDNDVADDDDDNDVTWCYKQQLVICIKMNGTQNCFF